MDLTTSGDGDTVSFLTDTFGTFLIGQVEITEPLEGTLTAGGTSYEEKTVYVPATAFEQAGKYLLIGEDKVSNGNLIAYLNNNGSEGWQTVTVSSDASGKFIELNNANAVWTAAGDAAKGFTLSNGNRFIGGTDANTLKSKATEAVKVTYDAAAVRLKTASGTVRYLYYSTYGSENWKWSTSANSSTSSRQMWIYKETTVQIPTSVPVTYSVSAESMLHVLSTDTAQLQFALLADGAASALPGVKHLFLWVQMKQLK